MLLLANFLYGFSFWEVIELAFLEVRGSHCALGLGAGACERVGMMSRHVG